MDTYINRVKYINKNLKQSLINQQEKYASKKWFMYKISFASKSDIQYQDDLFNNTHWHDVENNS